MGRARPAKATCIQASPIAPPLELTTSPHSGTEQQHFFFRVLKPTVVRAETERSEEPSLIVGLSISISSLLSLSYWLD